MSHAPKPLPARANETSAQQKYRRSCRLSFLLSSQPFSRPSFSLASAPSSRPRQEASPASSCQRPYLEKTGRLRRKSKKTTIQQAKSQLAISMKTPIQFAVIALQLSRQCNSARRLCDLGAKEFFKTDMYTAFRPWLEAGLFGEQKIKPRNGGRMQPTALAVGEKANQNQPQRGETRDDGETVPTTRSDLHPLAAMSLPRAR